MKKAAIYCRISDDREGLGLGVKRQEEDCLALAERNGWEVVEIFTDNDVSAYSGKLRPQYQEMIRRIKLNHFDVLIAWHNDRLHRSPRELEDFIDLCEKSKISVETVQAGLFDLSSSSGRATARILGAVARQSSEQSSDRIKRKALEVAKQGKPWGKNQRCFGYNMAQTELIQSEAQAIREITTRFLAGESLYSLTRWLNEKLFLTPAGNPFKVKALKDILKSARISGRREYYGEIVADAIWPAIISKDESDAIRAIFSSRAPKNYIARSYLLTGILICGLCGRKLISNRKSETKRYICRKDPVSGLGCGGIYITAHLVENFIAEAVLTRLNTPNLEKAIRDRKPNKYTLSAHRELSALSEREIELAEMFALSELNRSEFQSAKNKITARKRELELVISKELTALTIDHELSSPDLIVQKWGTLNLDRQRAIIKAVLEHVAVVKPLNSKTRFDPARLQPVWRI